VKDIAFTAFAAVAAFLVFYFQGSWGVGVLSFVILMVLYFISMYIEAPDMTPPEPQPVSTSGRFGRAKYQDMNGWFRAENEDDLCKGVFLGQASHPSARSGGIPICSKPEHHVLIISKTGSGKGARILIPTLLRAHKTSALVFDPSGALACVTARARAMHSHVHVMNPWGELGDAYERLGFPPATFNPLDLLDRNDPNVVSVAEGMAQAMSPKDDHLKEPFWPEMAAQLIAATLLYLTEHPGEQKTLRRLSDILSNDRKTFTRDYLSHLASFQGPATFDGAVKRWSRPFLDMPDNTFGGVFGHVANGVGFLSDPQIRRATDSSSFSMKELTGAGRDCPTTVYLVIPPDKVDKQKTWLRLMITAGTMAFRRKATGARYRCMFMIDEFQNLGRIEKIATEIATLRTAGVDFVLATQTLSALKDIYGERHADIVANCGYQWYCNIADLHTAEEISKRLGRKTVAVDTKSENKGTSTGQGGGSTTEGESVSHSEMGVDLLTPDEVLRLGSDTAILFTPRFYPHYLRPIDYWNLQDAFAEYPAAYPELYYDYNLVLAPDRPQCDPRQPPYRRQPPNPYRSPDAKTWPKNSPSGPIPEPKRPPIDLMAYSPLRNQTGPTTQKPAPTQGGGGASHFDPMEYAPEEMKRAARQSKPAPAEEKPASTFGGSTNYDPNYYSDENIEKRKREQDKRQG